MTHPAHHSGTPFTFNFLEILFFFSWDVLFFNKYAVLQKHSRNKHFSICMAVKRLNIYFGMDFKIYCFKCIFFYCIYCPSKCRLLEAGVSSTNSAEGNRWGAVSYPGMLRRKNNTYLHGCCLHSWNCKCNHIFTGNWTATMCSVLMYFLLSVTQHRSL